jgi:hypothetical protein
MCHKPINVPTAGAQAFCMDHTQRERAIAHHVDWWLLTTTNAAGTNSLTCLPKHKGARDYTFSVTHPISDQRCLTSAIALTTGLLTLFINTYNVPKMGRTTLRGFLQEWWCPYSMNIDGKSTPNLIENEKQKIKWFVSIIITSSLWLTNNKFNLYYALERRRLR